MQPDYVIPLINGCLLAVAYALFRLLCGGGRRWRGT